MTEKIIHILTTDIMPYVESHGGRLRFHGFENGVVRVSLSGACKHCSAQIITLKAAVERRLRLACDEVDSVLLVQENSPVVLND